MNILFLTKTLGLGGVAVVTSVLANKFAQEGHNVSIFIFSDSDVTLRKRLSENVKLYIGNGYQFSWENILRLRDVLVDENIDIVINQWGLPYLPAFTLSLASKNLNLNKIVVYHSNPLMNGRIQDAKNKRIHSKNSLYKFLYQIEEFIAKLFTSFSMRFVYKLSDLYVVLSPSYISAFSSFTHIKHPKKLIAQANPITLKDYDDVCIETKEKELLFVGRIDNQSKRLERIVSVWQQLEHKFPDWKLTLVGEGKDLENIKSLCYKHSLKRVYFEGYKQPMVYYKRASILLLTSDFEGFPLVLPECMSFGVVPVVYGSFPAVYDIVDNGINGMVVKPVNGTFDLVSMVYTLSELMSEEHRIKELSVGAIQKSRLFSLDKICSQWNEIFKQLKNN